MTRSAYFSTVFFGLLLITSVLDAVKHEVVNNTPVELYSEANNVPIWFEPYGYVKLDVYFDSRQTIGLREDQILFFPAPYLPDKFGRDINAHPQFTMSPAESRMGVIIHGPKGHGIESFGLIEGDFEGPGDTVLETFRLRHAMGKIIWSHGSFLFGQFWHPIFILECFPHTLSFNYGAPFEPQARFRQLRLTERYKQWEFIIAATSQSNFKSNGPNGATTDYMRNSTTPSFHWQVRYYWGDHVAGFFGDFKRLVPLLVTSKDIKTDTGINSGMAGGFAAFNFPNNILRTKVTWAQNANDQLLISGFGVRTSDPLTGCQTYANTAAIAWWVEGVQFFCDHSQEVALFGGYTKNLGSTERMVLNPSTGQPTVYGLLNISQELDYVWRVSPRWLINLDPVRIGIELEYTRAAYGTIDSYGKVFNTHPVGNFRFLTVFYYVF